MENLSQEAINTAMKDPEHLKKWLLESGRAWLVFNAKDLVEAIGIPGATAMAEIVTMYREYRRTQATGRCEMQKHFDNVTNQEVEVEVLTYKDETLEVEELDRAIRHLIGLATEKDPEWSLLNAPL